MKPESSLTTPYAGGSLADLDIGVRETIEECRW